jgi:hypothetical protein
MRIAAVICQEVMLKLGEKALKLKQFRSVQAIFQCAIEVTISATNIKHFASIGGLII